MSGARNLHRLAGTLDRLRRAAAVGPCYLCEHSVRAEAGWHGPWPVSVGWIEGWNLHPKGVCARHAAAGPANGFTVHTLEELA